MLRQKTLIAIVLAFVSSISFAEESGYVVFRGIDGELTAESVQNLKALRKTAREKDGIVVWISFGVPFQPNPALRTPEIVAQETAIRDQKIAEIIQPLVDQGKVWYPVGPSLDTGAPGVLVVVSHQGLRDLARDRGVKHIGHLVDE